MTVSITGVDLIDGVNFYLGTEQQYAPATEGYTDADSATQFSSEGPYLVEINNTSLAVFPLFVFAKLRAIGLDGSPIYEFLAPVSSSMPSLFSQTLADPGVAGAEGVWEQLGNYVQIPSAGTWLVYGSMAGHFRTNAESLAGMYCIFSTASGDNGVAVGFETGYIGGFPLVSNGDQGSDYAPIGQYMGTGTGLISLTTTEATKVYLMGAYGDLLGSGHFVDAFWGQEDFFGGYEAGTFGFVGPFLFL